MSNLNSNPDKEILESATQAEREDDFASKLVESLDLPASLAQTVEKAEKENRAPERKKEVLDEEPEPEEEEAVAEKSEEEQSREEEKDPENEDEELIPKSKVQKRIDEVVREKKQLEARLRKLEEASSAKKDDDLSKLEDMSEEQLKDLKRQVRIAQAKNASDDSALAKLVDLEEKIDQVRSNAPQRLAQRQVQKFEEAVASTRYDVPDFDKASKEIFSLAKGIFEDPEFSDLKNSVNGQAIAWKMATRHYLETSKLSAGKQKTEELGRQVNTLKKKVAIDTGSQKSPVKEEASEAKLFKKAKYGDSSDKLNFFKSKINVDGLVDKEYLERYA